MSVLLPFPFRSTLTPSYLIYHQLILTSKEYENNFTTWRYNPQLRAPP
jgi:hypothetical protein